MGAKRPARRDFLKHGAALAGGITLGAAAPASGQSSASGQSPASDHPHAPPSMIKLRNCTPGSCRLSAAAKIRLMSC